MSSTSVEKLIQHSEGQPKAWASSATMTWVSRSVSVPPCSSGMPNDEKPASTMASTALDG